jgi:hypothetical protein
MQRIKRSLGLAFGFMALLCGNAAGQSKVVATYAVHIGPRTVTAEKVLAPGIEMVGGQRAMKLGPEENGRTVEITVGTYIFLRFPGVPGAMAYTIQPTFGVLEAPSGVYSLPKDVIGMVQALNEGNATITVHAGGPSGVHAAGNPSGTTTLNWSGYGLLGGPFKTIVGRWIVPTVQNDAGARSLTWIGIDGFGNSSLIQVGTGQDYSSGNILGIGDGPQYYAWWEILPAPLTKIRTDQFPVSPGDQMLAIIAPVGGQAVTVPNTAAPWSITLNNQTQHWTFITTPTYGGPLSSAEWIEEAPLVGCCIVPLADYGSVTFDVFDWVNAGASPAFTPAQAINMVQGGVTVSTPSNPDGDVDGFTVTFGGTIPGAPGPFVTTTSLPNAVLHQFYQQSLGASGPAVIDWSWTGNTPPGLSLDPGTGTIGGVPTVTGTFAFTVSALEGDTAGVSTQKQPLTLTVLATAPPPPPPNFTLSSQPLFIVPVTRGAACSASSTISVDALNGFNQAVTLAASNLPLGVTATFTPGTTTHTSVLKLSSNPCVMGVGSFTIKVTGKAGNLTHSTEVIVFVPPHCIKPEGCPQQP